MTSRRAALGKIIDHMNDTTALVSTLGRISRDLYDMVPHRRHQCFYSIGAMGSVLSFGIGLALAKPVLSVYVIEGDGSLMMSLGTLVTFKRYESDNLRLIIIDNGQYESTGGQPSQPRGFELEEMCRSAGFPVMVAHRGEEIDIFFSGNSIHKILVVKTDSETP